MHCYAPARNASRSINLLTVSACQRPPRGVAILRRVSSAAMPRSVSPFACSAQAVQILEDGVITPDDTRGAGAITLREARRITAKTAKVPADRDGYVQLAHGLL
jgi:hypothetical protein